MTSTRFGCLLLASLIEFGGSRATVADQPANVAEQQTTFTLNPKLIDQARKAAAVELAKPRDLKERRPSGLEDLDSPDAIQRAVEKATTNRDMVQLAYLGEHAFDALVALSRSDNFEVCYRSCDVLKRRGSKAVSPLCDVLRSKASGRTNVGARALGDIQDPAAVPALLEVLNEDRSLADSNSIAMALMRIKDKRAIEPIRKAAARFQGQAGNSLGEMAQQIEKPTNFVPWRAECLPVRQLCFDVPTLHGKSFGPKEVEQLVELLNSDIPQVGQEIATALADLRAVSVVPAVIRADQNPMQYSLLAKIPTPASVDFIVAGLQSPTRHVRHRAAVGLGWNAGRWGVPLLVGMLDDPSHFRKEVSSHRYAEQTVRLEMPDVHTMHDLLHSTLAKHGLKGTFINVRKSNVRVNVIDDMTRAKAWWAEHGNDFLDGKEVPNPKLTLHRDPGPSRESSSK